MASNWRPDGWRGFEGRHLPEYPDAAALGAVTATLSRFPPLVFAGEARALQADLAEVAAGKLVHGRDCATFRLRTAWSHLGSRTASGIC